MDKERIDEIVERVLEKYVGKRYGIPRRPRPRGFRMTEERIRNSDIQRDTFFALNEERGISNEVVRATKNITSKIPRWLERAKPYKDRNGMVYHIVETNEHILSFDIRVRLVIYDLTERQRDYFETDCSYNEQSKILTISLARVNGVIDKDDFYDAIQHELHHVYQEYVRKGRPTLSDRDNDVYSKSDKMINSSNDLVYHLGIVIYLSFKYEQEAFANGLYNHLVNNLDKPWEEVYRNSVVYEWMGFLKESKSMFKNNIENVNKILLQYNLGEQYNYEKIMSLCDTAYNELVRIAGRVISLVKDRFGLKEERIRY